MINFENWKYWVDHPANPLIIPKRPEWIIGDPAVVLPNESPDGKWHLFAHGILFGIEHFISTNGVEWINTHHKLDRGGMRAYVYKEGEKFYIFYERELNITISCIFVRESTDLFTWSEPRRILKPKLIWEGRSNRKLGCPCVIKTEDKYRLYYAGGNVFLWDCLFFEPKYIGVAEAENIHGPYKKSPRPIIAPSKKHPYRNFASGGLKVLKIGDLWIGFNNGIYKQGRWRNRSSILLLKSEDGLKWTDVFDYPIIYPTTGWKRSFVYQLDVKKVGNEYWLYYNARDGWCFGIEGIGLAKLQSKLK
ncbi:MAG: glycosyl hydrolase family 43 [Candidatus Helarchaeota archaeon]|nr:glycosyl hydrolase family 43 [Candidatus Helarchaeota archaeon]